MHTVERTVGWTIGMDCFRKEEQQTDQEVKMKDEECRLCLAALDPDDCGYSIAKNARFRKALEQVFTFKISFEAADLPEYTCKQCSWNVLDFQSFSELVKANQEKLQERSQRVDGHGKGI
uniref:ZAD domain-containing protein n=1 Tax=Anopheles stephensi TaxID=30069 RepID=A0A182Y8A8_ANOST